MSVNQKNLVLSSGFSMPIVGLGTSHTLSRSPETMNSVRIALQVGYRHIDTGHIYGNEEDIGDVVKEQIDNGTFKREDIFITTKLWITEMSPERVKPACAASMKRLRVDYIDLYLIHWPMPIKQASNGGLMPEFDSNGTLSALDVNHIDTWKEMENLVKDGLVRSIGLSNFNSRQIERILSHAEIPPAVNQIECHPYLQQNDLIEFCKSRDIAVTAYSPLGSKKRSIKIKYILDEPAIKDIAEKHNKTSAQIVLRFHCQRGLAMVPFSLNSKNIESNLNIFDFELDDEDIQTIRDLDAGLRFLKLEMMRQHPEYPFER